LMRRNKFLRENPNFFQGRILPLSASVACHPEPEQAVRQSPMTPQEAERTVWQRPLKW
jgi:hypothetical protein